MAFEGDIGMRTRVTVPHDSGLPADSITNTWAFIVPNGTLKVTGITEWVARLEAFYDALGAGNRLSTQYNWAAATFDTFDYSDPPPRIPADTRAVTITQPATTGADYPPEVAVVLSMEGLKASGVNIRRRRGRVYVGPLQLDAGDQPNIPSSYVNGVVDAANTHLLEPGETAENCKLAVYSPYTHHNIPVGTKLTKDDEEVPSLMVTAFHAVVKIWVDNAWDTVRRRGTKATTRSTHTATIPSN